MRSKPSFKRKSGLRDAKLIIIATEGDVTERTYFNGVAKSPEYRNSGVHVEVLVREDGGSDPKNCLQTLNKFKKTYNLNKHDELWLVCDVDRWGDKKLAEVNQLCRQKGYKFSVSNPCFEIWLLIHHFKISTSDQQTKDLLVSNCDSVGAKLREVLGGYNKAKLKIDDFLKGIEHAVSEANTLEIIDEDWPNGLGTKVHHLVKSMLGS
ncbi:MAG TPA: RloB family protein [Cyclobacteriaceae bacterium]|nr:RloB family protein [Cyclobacteriaceae bacterium]